MKKSKKIFLVIISILSCLIIASVPCFAATDDLGGVGEVRYVSQSEWSNASGVSLLDWVNVVRMYSMNAATNVNMYKNTYGAHGYNLSGINYKTPTPGGGIGASLSPPRIGFQFFVNTDATEQGTINAKKESNTYLSKSTGVYVFDFDLFLVKSDWSAFLNLGDDYYFNGYELCYTPNPSIQSKNGILGPGNWYYTKVEDMVKSVYKGIYHSSFDYVGRASSPALGHKYHVRVVAPLISNTTHFNLSVALPSLIGYEFSDYPTVTVRMDNLTLGWYPTPYDVPGYVHIPEFDNSYESYDSARESIMDSYAESIDTFVNISSTLGKVFRDITPAFLFVTTRMGVLIDNDFIKPILLISLVFGLFTFLISSSNLLISVLSKKDSNHSNNTNNTYKSHKSSKSKKGGN